MSATPAKKKSATSAAPSSEDPIDAVLTGYEHDYLLYLAKSVGESPDSLKDKIRQAREWRKA